MSSWDCEDASSCEPPAKHRVRDGHDAAVRNSTAFDRAASGAAVAVHLRADHRRISPCSLAAVSPYAPTPKHMLADRHAIPATPASGLGDEPAGSGAFFAVQPLPDQLSSIA